MGHFKLRDAPGATIPPHLELGVTMTPAAAPAVAPAPACAPKFDEWLITTEPADLNATTLASDWQILIAPGPGVDTCDGCLEWASDLLPIVGASITTEPTILSLEPASDCVGLIVTVAGQSPPPERWQFIFRATLNGQPFGRDATFLLQLPIDHEWTGVFQGGATDDDVFYPLAVGDWTIRIDVYNVFDPALFSWNYLEPNGPSEVVLTDMGWSEFSNSMGFEMQYTEVGGTKPEDIDWSILFNPIYDGSVYWTATLSKGT